MSIDPAISLAVSLGMVLLFAAALAHKLHNLVAFRLTLEGYLRGFGLDGLGLQNPLSLTLIFFELVIVAACLAPTLRVASGVLACATLALYAFAMSINLLRAHLRNEVLQLDCGCSWGTAGQSVGMALVIRNMVLAATSLLILLPVDSRPLGVPDSLSVAFAILSAALLYSASNKLLSLEMQRQPAVGNNIK